ncbi:MAG: ATP-dependent sacrificial sulfur transferase LarE [Calditrichae bacterium]|nr:ATP-dependent sacrificial sulfur transferase LarE [Calditrichota bacterium]MCB9058152.1 ATP-dependent sacrificial sulfur transferase LarE [Calditrichia bacterium]
MSQLLKILQTEKIGEATESKLKKLKAFFIDKLREGMVITFSGGVDSTFLLWIALQTQKQSGGRFLALSTTSASMPDYDKTDANIFTSQHGIEHIWVNSNEIENPEYQQNDKMRCYHCKTELFSIARETADEKGMRWIVYGYNASDVGDIRPGHQAAIENDVLFPLSEFGLEKNEIRFVLAENGISVADKPASPCLSSRIAHGIQVTEGRLADIAAIEGIIRNEGLKVFRVRINKSESQYFLRIEIAENEMEKVLSMRQQIINEGKKRGYKWVTLDLAGYRTGGGTE